MVYADVETEGETEGETHGFSDLEGVGDTGAIVEAPLVTVF
jgi:hypothetical protein